MSLDPTADIPEPEDFGIKEVYAFFGLATYCAQVLEKGLLNMVVAFRCKGFHITRDEIDALFESYEKKTLGQLLKRVRKAIDKSSDVDALLDEVLKKRNWLAHQFFADRSIEFTMESGRKDMIQELQELIILFKRADHATELIYLPILRGIGMTVERVEQMIQEMEQEYLLSTSSTNN